MYVKDNSSLIDPTFSSKRRIERKYVHVNKPATKDAPHRVVHLPRPIPKVLADLLIAFIPISLFLFYFLTFVLYYSARL